MSPMSPMTQATGLLSHGVPAAIYASNEQSREPLSALEEHMTRLEKQLESVIKMVPGLPADQQDDYWALAADLQKAIREVRRQVQAERAGKPSPTK
jgi:hypothetical protein